MTKEDILNGMSEEEFYSFYPTKESWEQAQQEMNYGGSPFIQGLPFGAGITLSKGGTPYYGGPIYFAKEGGNSSPFNYGAFPAMSMGGAYDYTNNNSYPILDIGGDYSWINDTINQVNSKKKGGDITEQGGNQDFLIKRKNYVKDYIKNKVENNIREEESKKVRNAFIEMDSQPFYNQTNSATYQKGGSPQTNESWEDYQERLNEEKFNKEGGKGRIWDGTKWIKASTGKNTNNKTFESYNPYNPWSNLAEAGNPEGNYSDYIPDNDIRTGYRFGKKDFEELSKLNPNTKLTGVKVNYGTLGKIAPRIFGPKSVTFGTVGKYEDNIQLKNIPKNDKDNFKKSTYGDGRGPYPETETNLLKKSNTIYPSIERQKTILDMADPFNAHNMEMYKTMPKNPDLDPFNNPDSFKQYIPRNSHGGLNKFFEGGPEDPDPINMQPEYLQPKNSIDLFNNYVNNQSKENFEGIENSGLMNPDTNSSNVYKEFTANKKTTGVGLAAAKRAPLIADFVSSILEERQNTAKQNLKNSQFAMNKFQTTPTNNKNRGDYDINSGMFREDENVPVQFKGYAQWGGFNTMATGGIPKSLYGVNIKPGLYGTNGNNQFNYSSHLEAGKISQKDIETRDTLSPISRDEANLEAEKGETAVVNIDGMPAHYKIGGKRHFEGGTPLNLPDNSFIFSNTAKMKIKDPIILAQFGMVPKKSGYTPAEISKKYDINKFRKTLADPNSDNRDRKTAEMMISNYNEKLAKLSLIQESAKGFPQGIPVIAMPYVMKNEIDPSSFLPNQAEEQLEEQPNEETGEARYGSNVISQWYNKKNGGLIKAQEGKELDKDSDIGPYYRKYIEALNSNKPSEMKKVSDLLQNKQIDYSLSWWPGSKQNKLANLAYNLNKKAILLEREQAPKETTEEDLDKNTRKKASDAFTKAYTLKMKAAKENNPDLEIYYDEILSELHKLHPDYKSKYNSRKKQSFRPEINNLRLDTYLPSQPDIYYSIPETEKINDISTKIDNFYNAKNTIKKDLGKENIKIKKDSVLVASPKEKKIIKKTKEVEEDWEQYKVK